MTNKTLQYWLVKQEPSSYSWDTFARERTTAWTGVRNFQARKNLRAMKKGDEVFYYHSGEERSVVGLARVVREHYPDPTSTEGDWAAVDLEAIKPLTQPVTLATIKADKALADMLLVRNSRLSVQPVSENQFARLLELSRSSKS